MFKNTSTNQFLGDSEFSESFSLPHFVKVRESRKFSHSGTHASNAKQQKRIRVLKYLYQSETKHTPATKLSLSKSGDMHTERILSLFSDRFF